MNFAKKMVAAAGVLALSGAANAAVIAEFDVSYDVTIDTESATVTTTATLDDSGELRVLGELTTAIYEGYEGYSVEYQQDFVFAGTLSGSAFTVSSAVQNPQSCTELSPGDGQDGCGFLANDNPFEAFDGTITFDLAAGGITTFSATDTLSSPEGTINTVYNFTATAVPVPAAVWFFGSALAGLASIARKRNEK